MPLNVPLLTTEIPRYITDMPDAKPTILYCHCQYAQVVPKDVKEAVLRRLCESGVAFDAVADLCEMAARKDPALARIASCGAVKIAACFPRAVKGLFHQCDADLDPKGAEILNMRTQSAAEICARLAADDLQPNVPGKAQPPAGA
jgi:heterodisulfide reductase subunit A-like polyferredoxin